MQRICKQCAQSFEVIEQDLAFYDRVSPIFNDKKYQIPPPTLCPDCRRQRRLAFRNERHLYHRKCDLTQKQIISMYSPDCEFPVYSSEAWFGDKWDPLDYGQDFDFGPKAEGHPLKGKIRPFFEQFAELQAKVPRLSLISTNNENCDFCNIVGDSKNCYLIYGSVVCEDCYYGNPFFSKNCIDSLLVRNSQFSYQCIDCENLYECFYCQNCANSQNLFLCYDVANSHDCFMCLGLRQKSYCIFNKQYSKGEYQQKIKEFQTGNHTAVEKMKKEFEELKQKYPHKFMVGVGNENVEGDHIYQSKNCRKLFQGEKCEEVNYATQIVNSHNCLDVDYGEFGSFSYEFMGYYKIANSLFCAWNWDNSTELIYSTKCTLNSKNNFGCISLKHNQYCILNKQYTKEEYEDLVPRIIEHMKRTGEWGEFFPISLSPFGYNETLAQEHFPLTKEQAQQKGIKWKEKDMSNQYQGMKAKIPENIEEVDDEITKQILTCETCGKNYKIIPQELKFYRNMKLPAPRSCPDCRHRERVNLRTPSKLWDRKCDKCEAKIQTSYSPDRPETVYCEKCYLKEVY